MNRLTYALAITIALPLSATASEKLAPAEARLKADVTYLADDAREGRGPGTKGIEAAAEYIAEQFRQAGLKPAPGADGYFQPFEIPGDPKLAEGSKMLLDGPADKDFDAGPGGELTLITNREAKVDDLPIVFAGYGITAKDEAKKLDYDDYAGIDVKGKAVLIFRYEPQLNDEDSPFDGKSNSLNATFTQKAADAKDHGAAFVLVVNPKASLKEGKDDLVSDAGAQRQPVPMAMISRAKAEAVLAAAGQPTLDELESKIDDGLKPQSRELEGWTLDAALSLERPPIKTRNVVGVLEGSGPTADETIVVGAHYDHLGMGGAGSMAFGTRAIHNGADDNASGTSLMIELARRLASRKLDPLPRRVVFMAFSGEERGLLGSAYYVKEPLVPLKDTVAMINFDMVGRLNDKKELTIFGAGSTPGLEPIVKSLGESLGLAIKIVPGVGGEFFASDHASFYTKDIPVLFAFTGNHPEYHRPNDDIPLINFDGMTRIADLGELLLLDLAQRAERPAFTKLAGGGGTLRGGSGAYFGSVPAYGEAGTPGVKLEAVTEGGPAAKAGVKGGDIVVKFAGETVGDINDYTAAMGKHKPGDEVEVVVKRDGEEKTFKVKLGSRADARPRN